MKKLILGLLLTVGSTGFAMANTIEVNNRNLLENDAEAVTASVIDLVTNGNVAGCSHNYKLTIENCDGTHTTKNLGTFEGSCEGQKSGTMIMHLQRLQADCGPE